MKPWIRLATLALPCVACGVDLTGAGSASNVEPDASSPEIDASIDDGGASPEATVEPAESGSPGVDATAGDGGCALGDGGSGTLCGDTCVDLTRDRAHCGSCTAACVPSAACESKCVDVAGAVSPLRYELACTGPGTGGYCSMDTTLPPKSATLTGTAGRSYALTIRVRGVVEQKTYTGAAPGNATGQNAAFFVSGGTPMSDAWNVYSLQISSPAATFYLNAGSSNHNYSDGLDYTVTVAVKTGATLTLTPQTSDNLEAHNVDSTGKPIVVPAVPPAPNPFDGQFVQVDVVSVVAAP